MDDNKLTIVTGCAILAISGMAAMFWILLDGGGAPLIGRAFLATMLCAFSCAMAAISVVVR